MLSTYAVVRVGTRANPQVFLVLPVARIVPGVVSRLAKVRHLVGIKTRCGKGGKQQFKLFGGEGIAHGPQPALLLPSSKHGFFFNRQAVRRNVLRLQRYCLRQVTLPNPVVVGRNGVNEVDAEVVEAHFLGLLHAPRGFAGPMRPVQIPQVRLVKRLDANAQSVDAHFAQFF